MAVHGRGDIVGTRLDPAARLGHVFHPGHPENFRINFRFYCCNLYLRRGQRRRRALFLPLLHPLSLAGR